MLVSTRKIDGTDLNVFPLCLGGNVFGWTVTESDGFAILDRFAAAGGNFIDTADVYSAWVPGHVGGESETIIGNWMASRRNRHTMVIATKVGMKADVKGLAPATIRAAAEASLRRLRVDRIDLYYAHRDDPDTPLEDSLRAFTSLVAEGKVRHIAASNYTAPRFAEALAVADRGGFARYVAIQPHYNLVHRQEYENDVRQICIREGVACLPYYALAKGFLTGKYRPDVHVESARAAAATAYLDANGVQLLALLDEIAAAHHTTVAAVSLAWLRDQPTVIAPIASARTVRQLDELLPGATLTLSDVEKARLSEIGLAASTHG
jgi:aryl-alcohol dehydrogenase-like predicted oxidoreductase